MKGKTDGRLKRSCWACGKNTKLADMKEKVFAGIISNQRYAVLCCPECFVKDKHTVEHKRPLKAETGFCDTCRKVFDADTLDQLKEQMQNHTNETDHERFAIQNRVSR